MIKEELQKKAIELGIENAETLTAPQLKIAIEKAESIQSEESEVIAKATELGLIVEGKSIAELSEAILELEQIQAEISKQARDAELLAILSEYLGIPDIDVLSKDEVIALLESKKQDEADGIEVVAEIIQEGRTEESVTASNGLDYVFNEDAPTAFRYLGTHRTQKEWIADKDAIDLMVAGKLSFLTLKK